jgi:hypothetical protein
MIVLGGEGWSYSGKRVDKGQRVKLFLIDK